ncbi:MAG: DUF2085 domain-containing protein [Flammeovirgaceae bacterium]
MIGKLKDKEIGFVMCHQKPERSFFWKGKQFPVCARCTGMYIGYFTFPFFLFSVFVLNIWWTLVLIFPTYIDGITQAVFNRESNNFLRVTTGFMAGIGLMSLLSIVGKYLGDLILLAIK